MIKVWARRLNVNPSSLTIPVSGTITTQQVIKEAVARFRLDAADDNEFHLVKVTLEAGKGEELVAVAVAVVVTGEGIVRISDSNVSRQFSSKTTRSLWKCLLYL